MSSILNFLGFTAATEFRGLRQKRSYGLMVHGGSTFKAGRNEEKRACRRREVLLRREAVASFAAGMLTIKPTKGHRSSLTTMMLSNRRLRQRSVGRG